MVLTVHTKLSGAAAGSNDNVLEGSSLNQSCSVQHSVSRACAEATYVGTGCIRITCDLSSSLCEVSAATLVHITAGLLAAVDNVLYGSRIKVVLLLQLDQGDNVGSLGNKVLKHYMSRKVNVYVMCSLYNTYKVGLIDVKSLGMLLINKSLKLCLISVVLQDGLQLLLGEHLALGKLLLYLLSEGVLQHNQLENVADVHNTVEFVLRHDASELTVFLSALPLLVVVRELGVGKIVIMCISDVYLVRDVGNNILVASQMLGKLYKVLRRRINDSLGGLGRSVINNH